LHCFVAGWAPEGMFRMRLSLEPQPLHGVGFPVLPHDRQTYKLTVALHTGAYLSTAWKMAHNKMPVAARTIKLL
jgi:hypothetical protein